MSAQKGNLVSLLDQSKAPSERSGKRGKEPSTKGNQNNQEAGAPAQWEKAQVFRVWGGGITKGG